MADGDAGHGYGDSLETVGIKFGINVNKKSQKESEKAASNMISIISDLALIGRVAGDALNKMWQGVQNSVKASLGEMDDFNIAARISVDPRELRELEYVVGKIGGTDKDAINALKEMNDLSLRLKNPAIDNGAAITHLKTTGAVYNVDQDFTNQVMAMLKKDNVDLTEAIKLLATVGKHIDNPDDASDYLQEMKLTFLGNLENPLQQTDWDEGWAEVADLINNIDLSGLNDLKGGINSLKTAFKNLNTYFGASMGGSIGDLGDSILGLTNKFIDWAIQVDTKRDAWWKEDYLDDEGNPLSIPEAFAVATLNFANIGTEMVDAMLGTNTSEVLDTTTSTIKNKDRFEKLDGIVDDTNQPSFGILNLLKPLQARLKALLNNDGTDVVPPPQAGGYLSPGQQVPSTTIINIEKVETPNVESFIDYNNEELMRMGGR